MAVDHFKAAQSQPTIAPALLAIIESLSMRPTSGELLGALLRAEQAGYRRACAEIRAGGPFDDDKYAYLDDEELAERTLRAQSDERSAG